MRFTAQDCLDRVGDVVTEFLAALGEVNGFNHLLQIIANNLNF